jgi:hypothetical protein
MELRNPEEEILFTGRRAFRSVHGISLSEASEAMRMSRERADTSAFAAGALTRSCSGSESKDFYLIRNAIRGKKSRRDGKKFDVSFVQTGFSLLRGIARNDKRIFTSSRRRRIGRFQKWSRCGVPLSVGDVKGR